jgi:putative nucleotidyltransferase-like protein
MIKMQAMGSPATRDRPVGARDPIWAAVDGLVDRSPGLEHLYSHRLHLIAARRRRRRGRPVEDRLLADERLAALRVLAAPTVLGRVREAIDGPIVLMKGYEVAQRYEDPTLRPFGDLDLLVPDSRRAHRALLAAGFVEMGDPDLFVDIHHLRPVGLPGLAVPIEVHHDPKWPDALAAPRRDELLSSAIPSSVGVDGISTLPPAHHALCLAAHSWAHLPLRRIQELVDVAVMSAEDDRAEISALARRWGLRRIWETTVGCVDSLFYGERAGAAQRLWARHLATARERTVFESHVEKWMSPHWALPPLAAVHATAVQLAGEVRAAEGETWRRKASRARRAVRNASVPRSEHERQLGPEAHRRRRS